MKKSILLIFLIAHAACAAEQSANRPPPGGASRTLLFVDDHDILYRSGTHRVFHPFQRYPGNPVIEGRDKPWENHVAWNSVYRNPATGIYQLWYQGSNGKRSADPTRRCVVCYAESKDGITFTKPNLGLYDFNGIRGTNIVLIANGGFSDRYGASVVVDDRDPDPARRYKMSYYDFAKEKASRGYPGSFAAFSPDGIHWTKQGSIPLLRTAYGASGEQVPFPGDKGREWAIPLSMSDALDAMYDPRRGVFAIYGKMWIDGPGGTMSWKHGMGRTESRDFIHWSQPQLLLTPDDEDPPYVEFHTVPVFYYDDCYFGLMQILHRAEGGGVIDIEMALSRDGLQWSRPFRKPFALARSSPGKFDSGSLFTNATPVVLPDEIRFYYGAYSGGATGGPRKNNDFSITSGIGFATLPRDRFAGLKSDPLSNQPTLPEPLANVGQITLKPVELGPGTALTLNADAAGSIRVELLNERGLRVRGFSVEDAAPIHGNSLRHRVAWKGHSLSGLPRGKYLIRIHLDDAEAFALGIEND